MEVALLLIKYIGKDEYIDLNLRFAAKEGDIIDINDEEGQKLIQTGKFEEYKPKKERRA
ncbi:MAG: hypothetical protein JG776_450 [Caloramator sp.]|jgi:hypothetical protein|nr:hypothetical protein [Caloramator sp.]